MKRRVALAVGFVLLGFVGTLFAAENPTGTWKWTVSFGGQSRDATAKLKLEGDKLTGVYVGGQSQTETPLEDASFKDDKVSFTVVRERDGQKFKVKYSGTIKGDVITGKSERDGQDKSNDWEAKRQK